VSEAIEDFIFHPVTLVVLFIVLIVSFAKCSADERRECRERGGEMVESGTSTVWVNMNGMLYPITTTTFRCSVKEHK
jgi:hypothetical protein